MKTKIKKVKILIWVPAYRPWILGGNVNGNVGTWVKGDEVDLGKGFKGVMIKTPSGKFVVADLESGGIVGDSVVGVRADIEACEDIEFMKKQVEEAKLKAKNIDVLEPASFWALYEKKR